MRGVYSNINVSVGRRHRIVGAELQTRKRDVEEISVTALLGLYKYLYTFTRNKIQADKKDKRFFELFSYQMELRNHLISRGLMKENYMLGACRKSGKSQE